MLTLKVASPVTNGAHRRPPGITECTSVSVVTDRTVVRLGLMAMLEADEVPAEVSVGVDGGRHARQADLVLFDVELLDQDPAAAEPWMLLAGATVIAVYSLSRPDLTARARSAGIEWGITLDVTTAELRHVLRGVAAGVLADTANAARWRIEPDPHPREARGLTGRETEVLKLIASGLPNAVIATQLCVSINSVKSYIRSAYRKVDVTSRSQAVAWAIHHGLGGTRMGLAPLLDCQPEAPTPRSWVV